MAYKIINGKLTKVIKGKKGVNLTHSQIRNLPEGGMFISLPGGLQAYRTAVANVSFIPKGQQLPEAAWMTDYGHSYMSKVISGTPRAKEILINAFVDADMQGDMLQISATVWDSVNDCQTDVYDIESLISEAISSLPINYKSRVANRPLKVEHGGWEGEIGFVSENNLMPA